MLTRVLVALPVVVVALLSPAVPAFGQGASAVSVGLGFSVTTPTSDAAGTDVGPGFVIRLRGRQGFGPTIGMSWFTTPLRTDVGGERVELGKVSVRPLMLGGGYSRELSRRVHWGVSLAAGIASGHARGTDPLKKAFERLGVGQVGVRVSDCFAWKASTGFWIDLGPRFGMSLSVGYLGVAPAITITSAAGDSRRSFDLGSVVTSVGFTFGVF